MTHMLSIYFFAVYTFMTDACRTCVPISLQSASHWESYKYTAISWNELIFMTVVATNSVINSSP